MDSSLGIGQRDADCPGAGRARLGGARVPSYFFFSIALRNASAIALYGGRQTGVAYVEGMRGDVDRLRQIDIDANSTFSEIRAVRGEGQEGKTIVYPNPSSDGKVKIVFEAVNGTRDAVLTDMSGRVIKQWSAVTNNNLQVENMTSGYYSLRVILRETGEQSIQKIIVSRR